MKDWLKQLLTKILGNGFLVLLIVSVFYILYLRECKKPPECPAKDEVIVKKDIYNAMIAAADKPATIHIDTFYIKGDIVYIPGITPIPIPTVDPVDTTVNIYNDSLVKKDIDVNYIFKVRGILLNRKWSYKPIISIVKEVDSIPYPKIVEVPTIVTKARNGMYLYGIAGGNQSAFLFGGGLDFITKKNTEIGYQYQRFGNLNFHSVKFGGLIRFGKP